MSSVNDRQCDNSNDKEKLSEVEGRQLSVELKVVEGGEPKMELSESETDDQGTDESTFLWTSDDTVNCGIIFDILDKDGDGKLNATDVIEGMKAINQSISLEEATEAIKYYDSDGDGTIDFKEFLTIAKEHPFAFTEDEELLAAFQMLDQNRDGFIDEDDLKSCLRCLNMWVTDEEAHAMIDMGDLNKDGRLDFQEFIPIWRVMKRAAGL